MYALAVHYIRILTLINICWGHIHSRAIHSEIWGMESYNDTLVSHITFDSEFVVFVRNDKKIDSLFLSRFPTCDGPPSFNISIRNRGKHHINATISRPKNDDVSMWSDVQFYVCSVPIAPASAHSAVLLTESDSITFLPLYIGFFIVLILLSALFTGLNLSLLSLSIKDLELIRDFDEDIQLSRYATNIMLFRQDGTFMMVTILLGNTICNTVSAVLFQLISSSFEGLLSKWERWLAVMVVPSTLQLVLAEILPQIICTKFALRIGSSMRLVMVFFMVATAPISWPVAKLLDYVIGKEKMDLDGRQKISGAMRQHKTDKGQLVEVVENAMTLQVRTAGDVMTPISKAFMLSDSNPVNSDLFEKLRHSHTRIPVYKGNDKNDISGVLNIKDLLLIDESFKLTVGHVMQLWYRSTRFRYVSIDMPVPKLMLEMKLGVPLSIVTEYDKNTSKNVVVGIVTLEDNLEEVVGEIRDEKDVPVEFSQTLITEAGGVKATSGKEMVSYEFAHEQEPLIQQPSGGGGGKTKSEMRRMRHDGGCGGADRANRPRSHGPTNCGTPKSENRLLQEAKLPRDGAKGVRDGAKGPRDGGKGARDGAKGARDGAKGARDGAKGTKNGAKGTKDGAKGTRRSEAPRSHPS